jgi:Spy/CpxP family protein refolding chaperone
MTLRPLLAATAAALSLGLAPAVLAQADANTSLPDGPGKAELIKGCTGCHDATTISGQNRTPDAWDRVIGDMITNGADLTPEDKAAVYAYLVKNFNATPPAPPAAAGPGR